MTARDLIPSIVVILIAIFTGWPDYPECRDSEGNDFICYMVEERLL